MRKTFLALPILFALAFSSTVTLIQGLNIGVDIFFHLKIAESWASGQIGMFSNVVMAENHFPYPPLFHFLLVPSVWLNVETVWAMVLQVALLPLAVASFMFLAYKTLGVSSAFFGGFLVLGCMAYVDRVIQPQPQALDFILLPLVFYFFLAYKRKGYVVSSVLMVWNHGIVSIAALGGSLLLKLKSKEWRVVLAVLAGSSLILVASAFYLVSGLGNYGPRVDTDQEFLFWHDPLFIPVYLRLLIVGFAVAGVRVFQRLRGLKLSDLSKVCLLTIASSAIMIPIWADRWIQYCTIPLALLMLEQIKQNNSANRRVWYAVVLFFFVLMVDDWFFV